MKLKKFEVNHGGKFNADENGSVAIVFESNVVSLKGDEGAGKSTILDLFAIALGRLGGEKVMESLRNKDSGKIDLNLEFVGNDRANYAVRVTNSQFNLTRNGEKQDSPKELLKKVLGVAGISPMDIKNAPIEDIVKWLAGYSAKGYEDFEKQMLKLKNDIKAAKKSRADANRIVKNCKGVLQTAGYMNDSGELIESKWVAAEKKYAAKMDIKTLSAKLTTAGNKCDKFIENEAKVNAQKQRKEQIEAQIAALQKELTQVQSNIEVGEKWLNDNANVKREYDEIKKQYDNAAQFAAEYEQWQTVKQQKADMDAAETIAINADAREKEILKKQQELQWEVIPDIRGVEIVLEDSHEDEGEQVKAGFYYNGMNSRQLSASQWFGVVVQILKKNKVPVLLVDDASTLGSGFMDILNGLSKSGCYILMAEMERGQTELQIEYK